MSEIPGEGMHFTNDDMQQQGILHTVMEPQNYEMNRNEKGKNDIEKEKDYEEAKKSITQEKKHALKNQQHGQKNYDVKLKTIGNYKLLNDESENKQKYNVDRRGIEVCETERIKNEIIDQINHVRLHKKLHLTLELAGAT